jgi:hypothetical protein
MHGEKVKGNKKSKRKRVNTNIKVVSQEEREEQKRLYHKATQLVEALMDDVMMIWRRED